MTGFLPDFPGAEVRVSPNFGPRRDEARPDTIILHYTGMKTGADAEAWLCASESEVSSHYLVHEDGRVVQMVRESDRAWHAGRSSWQGVSDINSRSIGIEIVNPGIDGGLPDFPAGQISAVIDLCRDISARHGIEKERVLAHSDVAPGRKVDPGPRFPWRALADAGVGLFAYAAPGFATAGCGAGDRGEGVELLQSLLQLYGYDVDISGIFDDRTRIVVEAFQLHFRQERIDGVADSETLGVLHALLETLPSRSSTS